MRRLVYAVIGLGLVALVVVGILQSAETRSTPASAAGPQVSAQARRALRGSPPALAALHAQGGRVLAGGTGAYRARLRALRGHPVVVNFWASWCGPCRLEVGAFQRASVRFGRSVAFLGVDELDNRGDAVTFLRQHPVSYPSYADDAGTLTHPLHVQGLPTTAYYDRRGRLAFVHQGPYTSAQDLSADVRRYALPASA